VAEGKELPSGPVRIDPKIADRTEVVRHLQGGVLIRLPAGTAVTLSRVMKDLLGMDDEDCRRQVKTVFLNNRVVDDPDKTRVRSGDTVVLSGALPGLVGAMLRSDSPIKAMRTSIASSSPDGEATEASATGFIRLKVFNTVLRDHAESILSYGVYVDG
jgi:hypothetical protein